MKKTNLGKVCVAVIAAFCFLSQGCSDSKQVVWEDPQASVSVSSVAQAEKIESTETSVSEEKEETSVSEEASVEEPAPEPEVKEDRPEGVFLRLTQDGTDDPLVIDFYEDGSYIAFTKNNPAEKDEGRWQYSEGELGLAAAVEELVVNEFSLGTNGFTYVGYGSSGFPQRDVKDKDFFADSEKTITAAELEEYQTKLGGAPTHVRFPSEYAKLDDTFLGNWKDQTGMFAVSIFKISAEVGGYGFTIKDIRGTELAGGDAHIESDALVMHQGTGALEGGLACSAVKSDTGITVTLDSAALSAYGIPAGDLYEIHLTR